MRRKLNWPTLILSSIIVDLEPLIAIVAGLDYPIHGLLHTFLASILAGALVGFILYLVREQVAPYFADLALVDKEGSLKSFIFAGIVGWASHVLFDSLLLYPEMKPFYPLNFNPMVHLEFDQIIFPAYGLLFLAGVLVYPIHLYRTLRSESKAAAEISVGLVLVGLGAINIPADILCHAGFLLIVAGLFMLAHGLKRIMPHLSRRIFASSVMLAAAASLLMLKKALIIQCWSRPILIFHLFRSLEDVVGVFLHSRVNQ
ncbi:MAG: hypothetical protein QXX79_01655 [Candidatus Bathyarchaeia archaeon]